MKKFARENAGKEKANIALPQSRANSLIS